MRPAGRPRPVTAPIAPIRTSTEVPQIVDDQPLETTVEIAESRETEVILAPAGFAGSHSANSDARAERQRHLAIAIRQRIESRLAGRIRELAVGFAGDTVVLQGRCATYYTKQLAQHAALGVLEDEQLENAIIVEL